jgi:hypothetical protein
VKFSITKMLLHYLSYVAVLAAFAFITLSLASGLLYVSELIEEHSRVAKVVGQRGIYAIILLHTFLYFFDSLPLQNILFSIICHIVYLQNFSITWPIISLTSIPFIASCILVISDHFLWFFHFARLTQDARHSSHRTYKAQPIPKTPGFVEIATFFGVCVWLAPLFLFLSLSANDNALPLSTAEPGTPTTASISFPAPQARASLFKSAFSVLSFDSLRPKALRRDSSEGLIAPRSPNPARSPSQPPPSPTTFRRMSSPTPGYSSLAPPRSPGPPGSPLLEREAHLKPNHGFTLGTPPRRHLQPTRRVTVDSPGLGLRRTPSSSKVDSLDDSYLFEE